MPTYRYHEDSRDGKVYKCVLMPDGKWWAAENLAWEGAGLDYDNDPANRAIYGRLYSLAEVTAGVLPQGTHLPNYADWLAMHTAAGSSILGAKDAAIGWTTYDGDNSLGFSLRGSGYGQFRYGAQGFYNMQEMFYTWADAPVVAGFYLFVYASGSDINGTSYHSGNAVDSYGLRFIVDVFNVPSNFKLFGKSFQGFDRDATVTITRQIQVQESEGGSVTLIPTAPAQFDSWDIEVGLRVSAAQAQAIEASLPPYGTPSENALRLPPRGGGASFPGLLPLTPGETYDLYAYPMASPLDAQGRVAIGADLFSYRMSLRFFATHRLGASAPPTNTPTATTTTAPEWLTGKAITHSVVDPSTSIPTISRFGASTAVSTNFHTTKQGRARKLHIPPDCLSQDRADELVGFFRGVRHNPATIMLDNGANGFEAVSVYLTALSFSRGDGLYWTGSLEVVLA